MNAEETVHYDKVRAIYAILQGEREADLLLKNLNILDVHGESVYQGSILVYDKRIIALNPDESVLKVREVFDGKGLYAIPGLIDAHIHFESQLARHLPPQKRSPDPAAAGFFRCFRGLCWRSFAPASSPQQPDTFS